MKIWFRSKWRHLKFLWEWNFGHKTILKNCRFKRIPGAAIRYSQDSSDSVCYGGFFSECGTAMQALGKNEIMCSHGRVFLPKGSRVYGVTFDGIGVDLE